VILSEPAGAQSFTNLNDSVSEVRYEALCSSKLDALWW
jgi:hypothetical protein